MHKDDCYQVRADKYMRGNRGLTLLHSSTHLPGTTGFATGTAPIATATGGSPAGPGGAGSVPGAGPTGSPISPATPEDTGAPGAGGERFTGGASKNMGSVAVALLAVLGVAAAL